MPVTLHQTLQGIPYKVTYGFAPLSQMHGSVVPKACLLAIMPAIIACAFKVIFLMTNVEFPVSKTFLSHAWSTVSISLGFVLAFRSTTSYQRYWTAVTLSGKMAKEWFDAAAQMCAFAASSGKSPEMIRSYMECTIRLFSLMHAYAWQEIAKQEDEDYDVIGCEELEPELLEVLQEIDDPGVKKDIVHQWVLGMILRGLKAQIIDAPPPIVTRAFQELNAGMTAVQEMKRMSDCHFPFPYAQVISYVLIAYNIMTIVFSLGMDIGPLTAFFFVFVCTGTPFALNLIASELEGPLGNDTNDLNGHSAQMEMNASLMNLLLPATIKCPDFQPKGPRPRGMGPRSSTTKLGQVTGSFSESGLKSQRLSKVESWHSTQSSVTIRGLGQHGEENLSQLCGDPSSENSLSESNTGVGHAVVPVVGNGAAPKATDAMLSQPSPQTTHLPQQPELHNSMPPLRPLPQEWEHQVQNLAKQEPEPKREDTKAEWQEQQQQRQQHLDSQAKACREAQAGTQSKHDTQYDTHMLQHSQLDQQQQQLQGEHQMLHQLQLQPTLAGNLPGQVLATDIARPDHM